MDKHYVIDTQPKYDETLMKWIGAILIHIETLDDNEFTTKCLTTPLDKWKDLYIHTKAVTVQEALRRIRRKLP
jgi:hypothetical protein